MERSRHSLVFFIVLFIGLYALTHGSFFFGQWDHFGYVPWTKWVLLGLGIFIICSAVSSRPRRYRRQYFDSDSRESYRNQSAIYDKLDQLQEELAELRRQRSDQSTRSKSADIDQRFDELTERIINLEKIVTDRRYQLDEKISKL